MKEANEYFNRQKTNLISGLNTCLIGQIEKYDPVTNKADVILLPDGQMVVDVPVGAIQTGNFFIRIPYKPGNYVVVVFSQRDIDIIMHGDDATPTDRMLSVDDAIVLMGVNLFDDPLPVDDSDSLVIGQKDGAAKITIGDGKISLIGNVDINGGSVTITGDSITANGENLSTDAT